MQISSFLLVIESSDCQWVSSEPCFFLVCLNIIHHPFRNRYVDSRILTSFVFESSKDSFFPCDCCCTARWAHFIRHICIQYFLLPYWVYLNCDVYFFIGGKHVFFSHKSQFPSELLFLLYQAQASKPSAWMVLFLTVLQSQSFVFHSYFKFFFHFSVILLLDTFAGTLANYAHAFLYTF